MYNFDMDFISNAIPFSPVIIEKRLLNCTSYVEKINYAIIMLYENLINIVFAFSISKSFLLKSV